MKSKTILTITMLTIFATFTAMPSSTWAGSPQSHRWEGVAIGVGAAILGSAIVNNMNRGYPGVAPAPQPVEVHHYHHREPAGHWEIQKEWVPPVYEKVWNPAHYNSHGRWVEGQWIKIEKDPGYWDEQKVWVPYN